MPTLNWIGKDKVINHHLDVPFRTLDTQYTFRADATPSDTPTTDVSLAESPTEKPNAARRDADNLIIHGDNLEALKALLPRYEAQVRCIYIDPPYNTGNEGWVYNDNVNDPKLKRWLAQVVGKEGEDLSRHDKWLCMMYPRLKLLHKLLAEDGFIFVAIDKFEYDYLALILDEVFGRRNRIETLVWKKSYGGGSKSKHTVNLHEYIFFYAKNFDSVGELFLPPDEAILKYYKFSDSKFDVRGPYRLQPLATTSMDDRPNLRYPILFEGEELWPEKQWQWSQDRVSKALLNDDLVIEKKKGKWSTNYKQYLKDEDGIERGRKLFSIVDRIYTQHGTNELKEVMGKTSFTFPKPPALLQTLFQLVTGKNSIILDSFAGSGTTAHAVLNLNQQDGGNRQFILVEMEEYAETITAERVRRVMQGYGDKPGTGGQFSYHTLGERLFDDNGDLNPAVSIDKIREYIWFTETRLSYQPKPVTPDSDEPNAVDESPARPYFLGQHEGTAYYFCYEPEAHTTLDFTLLDTIRHRAEQYIIYADACTLPDAFLQQHGIIFKKIPRDISRL